MSHRGEITPVPWAAIFVAAFTAWLLVFFAGAFVDSILEQALCPPEDWASNMCWNRGVDATRDAMVNVYAAVSALFVGLTCVLMAPRNRREVTWVVFLVGSGLAVTYGILVPSQGDRAISAVLSGFVFTLAVEAWLWRKERSAHPPAS